jgi:hypothetical protein
VLKITDPDAPMTFDPWGFLGPKRRRMLDRGWPGLFRKHLLDALPVEKLAPRFHPTHGRPTKELHTLLGMLLLQQMRDLTDAEAVEELAYDTQWHYALNLAGEEDEEKYVSERTLRNYRRALVEMGLAAELFESTTARLAKVFKVDVSKQRLDSTHILSNMRRLSRIELFTAAIARFLRNLKRRDAESFARVPTELAERYPTKKRGGCFGHTKPSEAERTLRQAAEDLLLLAELFKADERVSGTPSYRLLARLLSEQCEVKREGEETRVDLKAPREIRSDGLQNPSDPDATYDGHKGPGYQVQLVETYREESEEDAKEEASTPDLIVYVEAEPAHLHDGRALEPALESLEKRDLLPKEISTDTSYGSDKNVRAAAKRGVELIAPTPGKPAGDRLGLEDFELDDSTGEIVRCPAGETPEATRRSVDDDGKPVYIALFDVDVCMSCDRFERCPKRWGKNHAEVRYDNKQLRLAKRRRRERTAEFREKYRWRAGQEASHARLKAMTGIGRLRVRTLPRVRYAAELKAAGFNILRCITAWRVRNARPGPKNRPESASLTPRSLLIGWGSLFWPSWARAM